MAKKIDITTVSEETRKRLYDLMDPDRTIANGVWNRAPLSEFEAFIAQALGYIVDAEKAERIETARKYKGAMKLRKEMGGVCFNPEHNIFCLATGPDCLTKPVV